MQATPEHDHVHLSGLYDETMHKDSQHQPDSTPQNGKQNRFSVNICVDFLIIEAQHLNRGDLSLPFRHIDVGQIVKHDEGQHTSAHNEHNNDGIQTLNHILETLAHIVH